MAHIKEPKGVDFIIQSPPLSDTERKEISELIRKMKSKFSTSGKSGTKTVKKEIAG